MLETQKKCNERREVTMKENEEYSRELIEIVRGNVKSFIGSPLRLQSLVTEIVPHSVLIFGYACAKATGT